MCKIQLRAQWIWNLTEKLVLLVNRMQVLCSLSDPVKWSRYLLLVPSPGKESKGEDGAVSLVGGHYFWLSAKLATTIFICGSHTCVIFLHWDGCGSRGGKRMWVGRMVGIHMCLHMLWFMKHMDHSSWTSTEKYSGPSSCFYGCISVFFFLLFFKKFFGCLFNHWINSQFSWVFVEVGHSVSVCVASGILGASDWSWTVLIIMDFLPQDGFYL